MPNPRDILNELKWKQGFDLGKAEIWYIHRGAPNDTKIMLGKDIVNLGKTFMETTEAMIPYHRVFRIVYDRKVIFERITHKS